MENEILDIIKKMIYEDLENEAYENRYKTVDFPTTVNLTPNFKVITDFNDLYFKKYKQILVTNSVVYALENNKSSYIDFIENHISNLDKALNDINLFKAKTTEFAILNLVSKSKKIGNTLLFNINSNKNTIDNNKILFDTINKNFISFTSFTNFYRNILFDFLSQFDKLDRDMILDEFLTSNSLDEEFIKFSKKNILKNRINTYKYFIIRNILSDNYLIVTTTKIESEFDKYIDNINKNVNKNEIEDEYDNELDYESEKEFDDEDMFDFIDEKIHDYLEKCIENNMYLLPTENSLRLNMLVNFLIYNESNSKEYDIETVEGSLNDLKKLKLINPLYKLDLIKTY